MQKRAQSNDKLEPLTDEQTEKIRSEAMRRELDDRVRKECKEYREAICYPHHPGVRVPSVNNLLAPFVPLRGLWAPLIATLSLFNKRICPDMSGYSRGPSHGHIVSGGVVAPKAQGV